MIPNATPDIRDGALGIATSSGTESNYLLIGACPALSDDALVDGLLVFTDAARAKAMLGPGAVAMQVAIALQSGVSKVYVVPTEDDLGGGSGSGTPSPSNLGTGHVAGGGNAWDQFEVVIKAVTGPAAISAGFTFLYSLDAGDHWYGPIVLPAGVSTYDVPGQGLHFTFTDGSGVFAYVGDTWSFDTVFHTSTDAHYVAAINAAFASDVDFDIVHVLTEPASTSAAVTTATAIGGAMSAAEARFRYAFAILDGGPDYLTDSQLASQIRASFASFAHARVMVCAGYERVLSPLDGNTYRRGVSGTTAARLAKIPPSEHPGRLASGALVGVRALYHDEGVAQNLDDARFTTHRTLVGAQGFYVTRGNMMAPSGSDYSSVMNRRVMDKGCKIARARLLRFLNDAIAVNPATAQVNPGGINEISARTIENWVRKGLVDGLVASGQASSVRVVVSRTANILSTSILPVEIRITPKGYAEQITYVIGFENPALQLAA